MMRKAQAQEITELIEGLIEARFQMAESTLEYGYRSHCLETAKDDLTAWIAVNLSNEN